MIKITTENRQNERFNNWNAENTLLESHLFLQTCCLWVCDDVILAQM